MDVCKYEFKYSNCMTNILNLKVPSFLSYTSLKNIRILADLIHSLKQFGGGVIFPIASQGVNCKTKEVVKQIAITLNEFATALDPNKCLKQINS